MKRKLLKGGGNPFGSIRSSEGFTLIELVMVILLIGILAAVVLPKFVNLTGQANKAASQGVVGSLGEGITTQLSKDLINNDLSTYVTIANSTSSSVTTMDATFLGTAADNPYYVPFLLLPNYTLAANNKGSGTAYNSSAPSAIGNSWWIHNLGTTVTLTQGNGAPVSIGATTCDNGATAPQVTFQKDEYYGPIANIDYVYSNGSTEDSYIYYMIADSSFDIEGFYLVPCPQGTV